MFINNFVHGDLHPGNLLVGRQDNSEEPCLVILDAGIVSELDEGDRKNFVDLFYAIVVGDGKLAGRLMIERVKRRSNYRFKLCCATIYGHIHPFLSHSGYTLMTVHALAKGQRVAMPASRYDPVSFADDFVASYCRPGTSVVRTRTDSALRSIHLCKERDQADFVLGRFRLDSSSRECFRCACIMRCVRFGNRLIECSPKSTGCEELCHAHLGSWFLQSQ